VAPVTKDFPRGIKKEKGVKGKGKTSEPWGNSSQLQRGNIEGKGDEGGKRGSIEKALLDWREKLGEWKGGKKNGSELQKRKRMIRSGARQGHVRRSAEGGGGEGPLRLGTPFLGRGEKKKGNSGKGRKKKVMPQAGGKTRCRFLMEGGKEKSTSPGGGGGEKRRRWRRKKKKKKKQTKTGLEKRLQDVEKKGVLLSDREGKKRA